MHKSLKMAWVVWFIGSLFYAYQYILRVMPSIMMPQLVQQFDLNASLFGQYSGVYYLGYALMHIPLGIMLDRAGPRKVMTVCILLSIAGLLPLLLSHYWFFAITGRFLTGIGSSAAILGSFKIIRMNFDDKQFPRMLSLCVTIGLLGAIYGAGPVNYLLGILGYQHVIMIFMAMGLALAVVTYVFVPEIEQTSRTKIKQDIIRVLSNKKVIALSIIAGLMVGPLEGFADVWGAIYLKNSYDLSSTLAASLPSLIFIGMCFGAPVLNYIGEKSKNYGLTIIGAGLTMASLFLLLLTNRLGVNLIGISFIVIGICCAYQVLAIYQASTFVEEGLAGLTTAVVNMIIMVFGYIFHSMIGFIVSHNGGINQHYALSYGITVIPVALLVAVACLIVINAKRFKVERETSKYKSSTINIKWGR